MSRAAKKTSTALQAINYDVGMRGRPKPGTADIRRWVMHTVHGLSADEIAARTKVAPIVVQASLDYVQQYKAYYSSDLLNTKILEITMERMEAVGKTWDQGLKATKKVSSGKKSVTVADFGVRLKTVESIRSMVETTQPKAPLVQNNTQFNTGLPGQGGYAPGMSFEARLREIRAKKGLSNNDEVIEAQAETADDAESLEDELDGIGVDLDDGDEEEDE